MGRLADAFFPAFFAGGFDGCFAVFFAGAGLAGAGFAGFFAGAEVLAGGALLPADLAGAGLAGVDFAGAATVELVIFPVARSSVTVSATTTGFSFGAVL